LSQNEREEIKALIDALDEEEPPNHDSDGP